MKTYNHLVEIVDRYITIKEGRRFVAGNANVDTLIAAFDASWEGCEVSVIFAPQNGEPVRQQYSVGMTVPPEVLAQDGFLYVTFVGTRDGNVVIETAMQSKPFVIDKEGVVNGADPAPPTPSEYQQLMAEISRIRSDIEAGLIKGDPGDDADITGAEAAKNAANEAATRANAEAERAHAATLEADAATQRADRAAREATVWADYAHDSANDADAAATNANEAASNANSTAAEIKQRADSGEFDGEAGHSPVITASKSGNVTTVYADGVQIAQIPDGAPGSDATATDVRINGSSIVVDGVADIPIADGNTPGLTKYNGYYGISTRGGSEAGTPYIVRSSNEEIDARNAYFKPIVSANIDYAVTASLTDGKSPAWTEQQKSAAKERMGVDELERDIHFLKLVSEGQLYDYETDESEAYSKQVPKGAMQNAELQMVGGKSIVFNQIYEPKYSTYTNSGILSSRNPDGTIDVSGTVTGMQYYVSLSNSSYGIKRDGTKYLYGISDNMGYRIGVPGFSNSVNGRYFIFSDNGGGEWANSIGLYASEGDVINAKNIRIYIVDLTKLFGAGNEPTSESDPRCAMVDRIALSRNGHSQGELISAEVVEVESMGKNLLDTANVLVDRYVSTTSSVVGKAVGALSYIMKVDKNTSYTVSKDGGNRMIVGGVDSDVVPINAPCVLLGHDSSAANTLTFNSGDSEYAIIFVGVSDFPTFVQVELGGTATAFKPYVGTVDTFTIPQSIRDLCPGYGWSAGSAYNYIDFESKKYVQRVFAIDAGDCTWSTGSGDLGYFTYGVNLPYAPKAVTSNYNKANVICSSYTTGTRNEKADKTIYFNVTPNLYIKDDSFENVTAFRAAITGAIIYYELETPIEVDLSSVLTETPLTVEAGGSLTFKNSLGDDYRIPVPNREKYVIKANEAV